MSYGYFVEFTVRAPGIARDRFETIVDAVAEQLPGSVGVIDPDLSADLAQREITFCMMVDTSDADEAMRRVTTAARAALHGAGESTDGWESVNFSFPIRQELLTL